MYIGFYNFYNVYNNNRMFTSASAALGDDILYPVVHLGRTLTENGHRVATIDTDTLEKFDRIVFFDYPTKLNPLFRKLIAMKHPEMYLAAFECEMLRSDNYNRNNHRYFKKVFTWRTDIIDRKKYFPMNFSSRIICDPSRFDPSCKDRFCTLIASNKYHGHPNELYSERIRALRWFECHHPEQFDLYGIGWDRFYFAGHLYPLNMGLNILYRQAPFLPRVNRFPSYRGPLRVKRDTLARYKFSICYENAIEPGYITEKIVDCMMAGSIPVYLGAPDIASIFPAASFIDKRRFADYDELYRYLAGMSAGEHQRYLDAMRNVLKSTAVYPYSAEGFTELLTRELFS
ncbi:MAG: hypothetical protein HZC28_20030 [Spirochaetes bacterium]|nr:hypothetical protein [Spirochaetota bacterium]